MVRNPPEPNRVMRCPVIRIAPTHSRVNDDGGGEMLSPYVYAAPTTFAKNESCFMRWSIRRCGNRCLSFLRARKSALIVRLSVAFCGDIRPHRAMLMVAASAYGIFMKKFRRVLSDMSADVKCCCSLSGEFNSSPWRYFLRYVGQC
jgi:hypothetical protein